MCALSWPAAAAGNYAYASKPDVKRDVSVAPGGVYLWRQIAALSSSVDYAWARRAWASPKLFFFSAWIADGRLISVPAYLRSGLPTFRLTNVPAYLHVTSWSSYLASLIVHLQFKWNIYLSLLCDWIFLCLQNHFSFPFFQVCSWSMWY